MTQHTHLSSDNHTHEHHAHDTHPHTDHPHADHSHQAHNHHDHSGAHGHTHGIVDPGLAATERGIWAIKWSFAGLLVTALLQVVIVYFSGSVALSILGLGPQREMTLGVMIYWSLSYGAVLQNLWWWWLAPVLTLMLLFLALYLIHLGFDEVTNPRAQSQG